MKNAYEILFGELDEAGEECFGACYASGWTIADVDERFARTYPESNVISVSLLGDFVELEGEEE